MKNLTLALITALTFALFAATASAQTSSANAPSGKDEERPPRPLVDTALDVNGDEIIDASEIGNAVAALKKLDRNADGKLTPDEYRPPRPAAPASGRGQGAGVKAGQQGPGPTGLPPENTAPPADEHQHAGGLPTGTRPRPPIVMALEASGDGVIDAGELANAVQALKKLDRNADGKLSPDEYRPPRPEVRPAPGAGSGQSDVH